MEIISNYELGKSTTFHVGGIAERFFIPENAEELVDLLNGELKDESKLYIISGGSNLLINDEKVFKNVISTKKIDNNIEYISNGTFYIGCSCRIQEVINTLNTKGYGGFEELYSLPALFGGIIYMNAGIGPKNKCLFSISDFVERVKVIDIKTKEIKYMDKSECEFRHRGSIFQNDQFVILGAYIIVESQDIEKSKQRIKDRIESCKQHQIYGKGTFGSCFAESNPKLLKIVSMLYRKKGDVIFNKANSNWLINTNKATYRDTIYLIKKCKTMHKIFDKTIECEVRIWE